MEIRTSGKKKKVVTSVGAIDDQLIDNIHQNRVRNNEFKEGGKQFLSISNKLLIL